MPHPMSGWKAMYITSTTKIDGRIPRMMIFPAFAADAARRVNNDGTDYTITE
jgi:hypothetical protein